MESIDTGNVAFCLDKLKEILTPSQTKVFCALKDQ